MDLFGGFNSCKPGFNSREPIDKNNIETGYEIRYEKKMNEWYDLDEKKYDLTKEEYNKFLCGYNYMPKLNNNTIDDNKEDYKEDKLVELTQFNAFIFKQEDDFSDLKEDWGYYTYDDEDLFLDEISDDEGEGETDYSNDFIEWEIR